MVGGATTALSARVKGLANTDACHMRAASAFASAQKCRTPTSVRMATSRITVQSVAEAESAHTVAAVVPCVLTLDVVPMAR